MTSTGGSVHAGAIRTFLIADIRGYTRFTNQLGDEAASRLAAKFAEVALEGIEAHGGTLLELRGDEALAVFISARQALRCAAELQSAFHHEVRLEPHLPLAVGIGLDAGEAVPVGDGYRGAALNMAARLCATAAEGEIRASSTIVQIAGRVDGLEFTPLEAVDVKGIEGPVTPFLVGWRAHSPSALPLPPATREAASLPSELDSVVPFVGRQQELRRLHWHWRRARHGSARTVIVTGESGIGKTRLAAALAGAARHSAASILYGVRSVVRDLSSAPRPPQLIILDDVDRAPAAELGLVTPGGRQPMPGTLLVLMVREIAEGPAGDFIARLAPDDRIDLGPLGDDAVRQIALLYADDAPDEVPVGLIQAESAGVPATVHRVASQWARNHRLRRVGDSAQRAATNRRELRSAEQVLIGDVGGLEQSRERARLYLAGSADEVHGVVCPYKGLAPFEAADAEYFFGRDGLVAEIVARLVGSPFVAVVGASGSGKTSVLRAGLLPALASGVLPSSRDWPQVVLRPGIHPVAELRQALAAAEITIDDDDDPGRALTDAVGRLASDQRLLIVVDQLEELFTAPDASERARFVEILTEPRRRAKVIVALRADHYASAAAYPALARALGTDQVLVGPVSSSDLAAIIERPAQSVGLRVEPELTQTLVADAGDEPGALPLLSTALLELWQHRGDGSMTLAAYHARGGLRGAVARFAEAAYRRLDESEQQMARSVFLRLAGPGDGDLLVRRRVTVAEFDQDPTAPVRAVIDHLIKHRLLSSGDGYVEVAHEALLREWPRLEGWLAEDAAGRNLRLHLISSAREWDEGGREPGDLYRGARLAAITDWAAVHDQELNDVERAFLAESRRGAELEADRQRHVNRRLRGLLGGAAAFLLVAIAAGVIAFAQRQEAITEAARADAEADRAHEQESAAERAEALARSRELAASAIAYLDDDPSLSKLLALAGASIADPPLETLSALHQAWAEDRIVARHAWGDRRVGPWPLYSFAPALSPDGRMVAMGGWDARELEVVDALSNEVIRSFATASGDLLLSAPSFTADGTRLVASVFYVPEEGASSAPPPGHAGLHVWDAATGEHLHRHDGGICGPALVAVGNDIAVIATMRTAAPCQDYDPRALELMDLRTGERIPLTEAGGAAAISADDRTVAYDDSAGDRAASLVIDVGSGEELLRIEEDSGEYFTRALNADGTLLLTGSRPIKVWDVRERAEVARFDGHLGDSNFGVFGPDAESVYSTGFDGALLHWEARTGVEIARYDGIGEGRVSIGGQFALVAQREDAGYLGRLVELGVRGEVAGVETCRGLVPAGSLDVRDGLATTLISDCRSEGSGTSVSADLHSGEILLERGGLADVQAHRLSPDGSRIASQEGGGTVFGALTLRDPRSGEMLVELEGACTVDANRLPGPDGVMPGCSEVPEPPFALWAGEISWSPGNDRIAVSMGYHDELGTGGLLVWDARDGGLIHGRGREFTPQSTIFTPDGAGLIVSMGQDDRSPARILWLSTDSWEVQLELDMPDIIGPTFIGFSPDGSALYLADLRVPATRLLKLDSATFAVLDEVSWEGRLKSRALSPDGSRIATGTSDGYARVWDSMTLDMVHEIYVGDTEVQGVAWLNDDHLAVTPQEGNILVYTTDPDELLRLVRDSLTRGFTEAECVRFSFGDACPTLAELRRGAGASG